MTALNGKEIGFCLWIQTIYPLAVFNLWKTTQCRLWLTLRFNTRVQGIFRRQENNFVRLLNFGSDLAGTIGYYRTKWYVTAEVGFDKAIVTNFKHSQEYRNQYEHVVVGWYETSTGGNFYYGGQAGYSFKQHDIYLKAGLIFTQDFKTKPMIPLYCQLGYNIKF